MICVLIVANLVVVLSVFAVLSIDEVRFLDGVVT